MRLTGGKTQDSGRHRLAIGLALVVLLIAVYFATFNGYAISRDEWFLFDATESMARRGNLRQNYEFDAFPPLSLEEVEPPVADTEPLQPILATPLFLLAQTLPGIGLAHTTWVFNSLITALTAGTLYSYGLALGYRARVAALTALVFGIGTIAWPYSRTFFREPVFTWLALSSAYLMMRLRQRLTAGENPLPFAIAFGVAFTGALFSKEASLMLVPVIAIEAVPARARHIHLTRTLLATLLALAALCTSSILVILNLEPWFGITIERYALATRLETARSNLSDMSDGVRGYLFSPARSIWLFSPVLLLGFAGVWRLVQQRRVRQISVPLVMVSVFIAGYAIVRGPDAWYGGRGWGARYMVPVTPFLALWLLPAFEALLERGTATWKRIVAGSLFALSGAVQIMAVLVPIARYYNELQANNVVPWQEGAWEFRWSPLHLYPGFWGDQKIDLAWNYAAGAAWLMPLLALMLALLALGWIGWWLRRSGGSNRTLFLTGASLGLGTMLALGLGLYAIRQDPRYYGDFEPARDLLAQLKTHLEPGDVIVLNDDTYSEFFMNYYKQREPVVYTLPLSPGARSSPEQSPAVVSDNPDELIHPANTLFLAAQAQSHRRLWLVINSSRFITWSVRPVEQYLSRHYFPLMEVTATDIARAVLFDMTPAPRTPALHWPTTRIAAMFGDALRLVGAELPRGTAYRPGATLPVSLLWEAHTPVTQDYTIGLLLIGPDGQIVAQQDTFPVNWFEPTQSWRPGSLHRDNRGLILPDDLAAGEYALWSVVYWWQEPNQRLPVTDDTGQPTGDHVTLATITVEHTVE